jgi:hypothetical protein
MKSDETETEPEPERRPTADENEDCVQDLKVLVLGKQR